MKNFFSIVETTPAIDRHVKAAEKLNSEISSDSQVGDISMEELSNKAKQFRIKKVMHR